MSLGKRQNAGIRSELVELTRLGIIDDTQFVQIKEKYPVTDWNYLALVRSFTLLGALTAMAGLVILVHAHLNWWLVSELSLALCAIGLFSAGYWLRSKKQMIKLGETAEFVGAVAVQALITVLAIHYSSESSNWPGLLGMETVVLFIIAYLAANRLVLWYSCANFFFWFGASTGYISGWGCYWLGMTYPVRFLAAGVGALLLSWAHGIVVRDRWVKFTRVYAHFGMLIINLAFWFLSLFGYYEDYNSYWEDSKGERLAYSLLWLLVSGGSLFAGAKYGLKMLRGYGLTFPPLPVTNYFTFVHLPQRQMPNRKAYVHITDTNVLVSVEKYLSESLALQRHKAD